MLDLERDLRAVIDDRVTPIALDEVLAPRPVRVDERSFVRRPVFAAVVVVVAVAAAAAAFVLPDLEAHDRPLVATQPARSSPECDMGSVVRCPATPRQAQQLIGIPITSPSKLPKGWARHLGVVQEYPPQVDVAGADLGPIRQYRRTWTPRGADSATPGVPYLTLRQRPTLPFESEVPSWQTPYALADGTPVDGGLEGSDALGGQAGGSIWWVKDGVWYALRAFGVGPEAVLAFANSLR